MEKFAEEDQCLAQKDKLVVEEDALLLLDLAQEDKRELLVDVFLLQDVDVDKSVSMENVNLL